ncbi:major mite allergen Der p 23-like [Amphibalanus amphitrite]|uniref:major mite allergen Der p 23-like n=1 Tax=Amphibalanus amphitrite TaxID=1232801 RepID=UPI001C9234B9|nr:major mite allergen Der p 23-like [Amphibalanus amphitrite]XP_043228737.1 major mite allergen Der p 23-like [Amphibalanus amphitrite]
MAARRALLVCALLAIVSSSLGSQFGSVDGTTTEPPSFQCNSEYGLFPDPDNCHAFYECNEFIPFHFDCPDNLAWNDAAHMCDYDPTCK